MITIDTKSARVSLLGLLFSALFPTMALCTPPTPPLSQGMSQADVLARWGEPTEKKEFEVSRRDLWRYPASQVIFQQGKVIAWKSAISSTSDYADEEGDTQSNASLHRRKASSKTVPSKELLNEILNELPDEKGRSSAPPPSFPGAPNAAMHAASPMPR